MCTLVTSGQVASNTVRPRAPPRARTALDTPCAEKMTVAPSGTSVELLDEHRALGCAGARRRTGCARPRGARRSARRTARARARRCRSRDRRRRRSRAGWRAGPARQTRSLLRRARLAPGIEEQHRRADGDRRVGDVEGREVRQPPVHVHEIDHVAEPQAVDHVAERAAEDQRQPAGEQAVAARAQTAHPHDQHRCSRRAPAARTPSAASRRRRQGS